MGNKNIIYIVLGTAVILSVPLLARAPWTLSDFVIAGILLSGTGLLCEFTRLTLKDRKKMVLACGAILLTALYIWAELAVGIFTTLGS